MYVNNKLRVTRMRKVLEESGLGRSAALRICRAARNQPLILLVSARVRTEYVAMSGKLFVRGAVKQRMQVSFLISTCEQASLCTAFT